MMLLRPGRLLRICTALSLTILATAPAAAQAINEKAVDGLVDEALRAWKVPGVSVCIVQDDRVVYLKGFGIRDVTEKKPVTPDTVFAYNSCTKAVAAMALGLLVDEGKITWDDLVRKHVPYFRLSDPFADDQVTLRDLLCHRTGLPDQDLLWHRAPWSLEETVRRHEHVKLQHPFRAKFEYSSIGYITAGFAIESAAGRSWDIFVQKQLLDRLEMKRTFFHAKAAQTAGDHASAHLLTDDGKVIVIPWYPDEKQLRASGCIKSTARDLGQWMRLQLGGKAGLKKDLVSRATLAEMHTPQVVVRFEGLWKDVFGGSETHQVSHGFGWFIHDHRGHLVVSHAGSGDGFRNQVILLPKKNMGVAIFANLQETWMPEALRDTLLDHLLGAPKKDWNAHYRAVTDRLKAEKSDRLKKRDAKQQKGIKSSRVLADYQGPYTEPAFKEAKVTLGKDGSLVLQWSSFKARLEHFHFDTFIARGDGSPNVWNENPLDNEEVVFGLGGDGEVASVRFAGQEFTRVRPKVR